MQNKKVFFVGLNKTATTSFSKLFANNNFKVLDSPKWWYFDSLEQFNRQVYTDGYEKVIRRTSDKFLQFPDLEFLKQSFPDSYFILQTRPIKSWLNSRLNKYSISENLTQEINEEGLLKILKEDYSIRNYWHTKVEFVFKNFKTNFMKLDITISDEDKVNKLEKFLKIKFNNRDFPTINITDENNFEDFNILKRNKIVVDKFFDNKVYETI